MVKHMLENTQYKTFNNQFDWRIDKDGLLRCTTNVLKRCVMPYTVSEIGRDAVPVALRDRAIVNLYVPDDELDNSTSLASLEGKPISVDHQWQVGGSIDSVGNVAGTPIYDRETGFLRADILVTDPATIKRITSDTGAEKLVDQSAAYRNSIEWVSGTTEDGQEYDGIQRNIEYNHIALLPQGAGRAGEEVRILNKDRSTTVTDFTSIKVGKSRIRVMNEDVEKLENEMDEKDKELANASEMDSEEAKKAKDEAETKNKDVEDLKSENEGQQAQIKTLKETINDITSADTIQASLNKALEDQAASIEILNAFVKDATAEFTSEIKSLHGHDLRKKVVQQVRIENKKPELTDEELGKEGVITGMFTALKDTAGMVSSKKTMSGDSLMKTMNSGDSEKYDTVDKRKALAAKQRAEYKSRNIAK